jgi:hypothetical protein
MPSSRGGRGPRGRSPARNPPQRRSPAREGVAGKLRFVHVLEEAFGEGFIGQARGGIRQFAIEAGKVVVPEIGQGAVLDFRKALQFVGEGGGLDLGDIVFQGRRIA